MMIDESAGDCYYYFYDGLGSVAALSNTDGEIVEGYTYDAFGNVAIHTSPGNDTIWLNGDAGTGYDYSSTGSPKGNPYMFTSPPARSRNPQRRLLRPVLLPAPDVQPQTRLTSARPTPSATMTV